MKLRNIVLMLALMATVSLTAQPVGWASTGGTTDGGQGQNAVVVGTADELRQALAQNDSTPRTIYIQARFRSNVLAEGCVFHLGKDTRLFQTPSSSKPEFRDYNIRFRRCLGADDHEERYGEADYFAPPYDYAAQPVSDVETAVRAAAGATLDIAL